MEADKTSCSGASTFVYRRWQTAQGQYVDSQGAAIGATSYVTPQPQNSPNFQACPDPAVPPKDGSAPFLSLPTELRVQIYGYLPSRKQEIREIVHILTSSKFYSKSSSASTVYSYLYRSPGRITKSNTLSREIIGFFHVNRQTREELLDSCLGDRTFVIEASLYRRNVGGLNVVPPQLGMTAWVKKLLLITILDGDQSQAKGIADLRALQDMTSLRELRIVFKAVGPFDPTRLANNPIHAVLSCIPPATKVSFGVDEALQKELESELGSSISYLFQNNADGIVALDRLLANPGILSVDRGSLSGSHTNHGDCTFPICQEQDLGIRCINSHTPGALPPTKANVTGLMLELRYYECGCPTDDKGFYSHTCSWKWESSYRVNVSSSSESAPIATPRIESSRSEQSTAGIEFDLEGWRNALQHTRRRWRSWGGH